ncbi:MAG: ATP-binding protein [Janthinobacterium lividum]
MALGELRGRGQDLRQRIARVVQERRAVEQDQISLMRDVLRSVTEGRLHLYDHIDALPEPQQPLEGPVPLDTPEAIRTLRTLVNRASEMAAISEDRRDALIIAVGEAAANAVMHAREGIGIVGVDPEGIVQVKVADRGEGIPLEHLPRVLLEMGYSRAGSGGFGLKIVLKSVDKVHLSTGPEGTTLLLEQNRTPPVPPWVSYHGLTL